MVIQLDRSYKICFKTEEDGAGADFSILDGFYEVVRSYGWNELNASGIDLQESLLDLAGIVDKTAIRSLQQNWVNDAFYYCIGMDQDRQIWVPESIIKGYPDPRIGSYKKLMLTIDLGVFANPEDFSTMGKEIMNYLRSNYGIDRPDGIVAAYNNQWMTVDEYEATDSNRQGAQGLVYVTSQTVIPVGDHTAPENEFILYFTDPPAGVEIPANVRYLGKPFIDNALAEPVIGAFSDTLRISYGDGFEDIQKGNYNSTEPCWYFDNEDIIGDNVAIERELNITFSGSVLKSIKLRSNFKKPFYVWKASEGKLLFTKDAAPEAGDTVYSDRTLLNDAGTISSYDTVTNTIVVNEESYPYYTAANQILITVGYRCRNLRPSKTYSAYSDAIRYAYQNLNLKKRITALEELLTGVHPSDQSITPPESTEP